jgi:UPF0755 protein
MRSEQSRVRQRNREATGSAADPHDLLFGDDPSDTGFGPGDFGHGDLDHGDFNGSDTIRRPGSQTRDDRMSYREGSVRGRHAQHAPAAQPGARETRVDRNRRSRQANRGRNRGLVAAIAVVIIALIGGVGWFAVRPIWNYFHPSNYSGMGTGSVQVVVHPGDSAQQIGQTLVTDGVVASVRAFTDAANSDASAMNIQPGSYTLHHHMSAQDALNLLLSPSSRVNSDVVIPEGATIIDVEKRLTAQRCTASSSPGTVCGLGLPRADVLAGLEHVGALGLPTDYTDNGRTPPSAEGFLYPATYPFDGKTTAGQALGQMASAFTEEVRKIDFTSRANALGVTPYQELIIASIAQAEAKYPADMAKVARVILNRLDQHRNLQIDATSAYAAKLKGLDPTKQIYADTAGPYNTYTHSGLPPTPIGNPGEAALNAAAHPAKGNWLYYVNGDAAGHLAFFHSENRFAKAVQVCRSHGWCP